jgi:uncharacterized protein YecT (DUF1311 family)
MTGALAGILLLAAAATEAAPVRDCYHARSMTDERLCREDAHNAERQLESAYEDALLRLSKMGLEAERQSFAKAQRAWLAYRKDFCTSISRRWGPGLIRDHYHQACMMDRARQRATELSQELERVIAPEQGAPPQAPAAEALPQ